MVIRHIDTLFILYTRALSAKHALIQGQLKNNEVNIFILYAHIVSVKILCGEAIVWIVCLRHQELTSKRVSFYRCCSRGTICNSPVMVRCSFYLKALFTFTFLVALDCIFNYFMPLGTNNCILEAFGQQCQEVGVISWIFETVMNPQCPERKGPFEIGILGVHVPTGI